MLVLVTVSQSQIPGCSLRERRMPDQHRRLAGSSREECLGVDGNMRPEALSRRQAQLWVSIRQVAVQLGTLQQLLVWWMEQTALGPLASGILETSQSQQHFMLASQASTMTVLKSLFVSYLSKVELSTSEAALFLLRASSPTHIATKYPVCISFQTPRALSSDVHSVVVGKAMRLLRREYSTGREIR